MLALVYNAATPIFEASDEFRHFLTVRWISLYHQLPVLGPSQDPFTPGQEAGQPPLFYLMGAAVSGWVDSSDVQQADFNPHGAAGVPTTSPDSKNLFVHGPSEDFPYHGVSLAAHLVRGLAVALGVVTVWLTFRLGLTLGGPAAGLLAGALVAFNPQFLFVSASVDNDGLITTVSTAALVVMVALLRQPKPAIRTNPRVWLLSALLGLAIVSKLSGLALLPLAAVVTGWVYRRQVLKAWLVLAAGPFVVAGWWLARNTLVYGEPTGLSAWVAQFQGSRAPSALDLVRELPGLFQSYWAVFGAFDIKADAWLYVVYLVITLAGLGGLLLARRRIKSWPELALLGGWFLVEIAALVRWTTMTTASTGRLLFPAVGALAVIVAVGLLAPATDRARWPVAVGVSGLLLGLAIFVPVRYIFPAYFRPVIVSDAVALGAPARQANIAFGGKLQLLGYDLAPAQATPGEAAHLRLYWHVLAPMDRNYSVTVQLLSGEGIVGQYDTFPGQGRIATRHLQPDTYFSDRYTLPVSAGAPAPLISQIKVGLYDFYANLAPLPATGASGAQLAEPIIGELPLARSAPQASEPPPRATFGEDVQLLAGDVTTGAGAVNADLTWRAIRRPTRDYTVTLQLLSANGQLAAQHDAQPREGAFPTSLWAAGETVRDHVSLSAPPGTYQLVLGIYEQPSLQRLPASPGGDAYPLGTVTIAG